MEKITEVRLTLAAFLYGIESDLKKLTKKYIVPYFKDLSFLGSEDTIRKIADRYQKDNPGVQLENNLEEAIDFTDFQESFTTLLRNESFLPAEICSYVKSIVPALQELTPIRNRVMHTRPLIGGDFAIVYAFVSQLNRQLPVAWTSTIETREKIERDPAYVLTLTIPKLSKQEQQNAIIHNLPTPDFDESGFIGRKKDVDDLKKLIFSNKVVSIIGDGGIGKTALALKIAYDIVDLNEHSPFELIIWTSAKTTMLTSKGIEEIYTTIRDHTGLINVLSDTLHTDVSKNEQEKISEILDYLEIFKTLLIIDNLETIQSEEVRTFIREAQMRCNIIITSRIGLGELEYPRKLTGLSESESASLIREIAKIRNSQTLLQLPQKTLIDIAQKLYFNPLALKWFISTVEAGISPAEVLNNKKDLLNFCLSNVYDKLSEGAIGILNTMRASRKNLRTAEIIYLSGTDPLDVRKFLIELFRTTLVNREILPGNSIEDTSYFISDFAKDFLSRNYPLSEIFVRDITRKIKELKQNEAEMSQISSHNEFAINAIGYRNPNERIAAKFLSEALTFSRVGRYEQALEKVDDARALVPEFFENYRVSAFIKVAKGDILGAEDDYLLAMEIEENDPRLLYYYAQFLLFKLEDVDKALEMVTKLKSLRPENPYVVFMFARIYNTKHEYNRSVHLLKNILDEGKLDSKAKRVAYTELLSAYSHLAQYLVRVESDYVQSMNHFKKSFQIFDDCLNEKLLDPKMIKNFADALYHCLSLLPETSIQDNQEYLRDILVRFDSKISLSSFKQRILSKYEEKSGDSSLGYLDNEVNPAGEKKIGTVYKIKSDVYKSYLFIEHESNDRIFAHMSDFVNVKSVVQFRKIRHGDLVSFDIGENDRGICARNVYLIEI